MHSPIGGIPGISPGQTVRGHTCFCASAPSSVGATFTKLSSSFGNLKPASLNAFPKSFNFGKSMWQVLQEVLYCRENAGIAYAFAGIKEKATGSRKKPDTRNRRPHRRISTLLLTTPLRLLSGQENRISLQRFLHFIDQTTRDTPRDAYILSIAHDLLDKPSLGDANGSNPTHRWVLW